MRALMLGCVSSAMATASSTDRILPKTLASGLFTGGGTVTGAGVVGGGVCAGGGAVGGAVGVCGTVGGCAAALTVMLSNAAPVSSHRRTRVLISLALPGADVARLTTYLDRGNAEDITHPSTATQIAVTPGKRSGQHRWTSCG